MIQQFQVLATPKNQRLGAGDHTQSVTIHNSYKMEATQVSINR